MTTTLEQALAAWRRDDGAWETRLVVRPTGDAEASPLVLFRRQGESHAWVELGHDRRGTEARKALMPLGLSRRRWADGPKAWGRTLDARIAPDALEKAIRTLWEATQPGALPAFDLLAQREPPPDNPSLVEAIRQAAERQDAATRQALYAAIANATLLVPIDPDTLALDAAEQRPRALPADPQGLPCWGAFTDWDALRQWAPAGHAFGPVHGAEFLAHVHDRGRCSVRINPDGFLGGELYPAEVQMMVEAVRQYYRQTMS